MADIEITVDGGTQKRLLTAGKYCDRDILVTATSGEEPEPPNDGKTKLYITVPANSMLDMPPSRNQVTLYIQQTVDRGVTIDWGDGSEPESIEGIGKVVSIHDYQKSGDYIINLYPVDGCLLGLGHGIYGYCVMGNANNYGRVYCNMLKKAVISSRGVTSIGLNTFAYCYSLSSVTIPDSVTSVELNTFYNCYSLPSLKIPGNVTSIGNNAFTNCYGMKEYHFLSPTPPTLTGTGAFSGIPDDCIIYVPGGSLTSYQTATNWATYADRMQEEPE